MAAADAAAPHWRPALMIDVDFDRPLAQRFAHVPAEITAAGRGVLQALTNFIPESVRGVAHLIENLTKHRFAEEARAFADHAGVDWRDILLVNCSYELVLASYGCSTIALATADGPVLARNLDWLPPEPLIRCSCLSRVFRGPRLAFATASWPGTIGVLTGLSGNGFAVAMNAVIGPDKFSWSGWPVILHVRRVVEDAPDFDGAVQMLTEQRLTAACVFVVVGSENEQRVVIERTATRAAQRWPQGDEALIATNDFRALFPPATHAGLEIYETTCQRFDALTATFAGWTRLRRIGDEELLRILSTPPVVQKLTVQHVLMRPASGEMKLFLPMGCGQEMKIQLR